MPPQDLIVQTDRRMLTQIVLNLVGNAVKFTDQGCVSLQLARRTTGGSGVVEIAVVDTGIGIRAEDQNKLFEAFAQLDDPQRRHQGTGLGLHLSQKLAELLGARITVQSKHGNGSTFTLALAENSATSGSAVEGDSSIKTTAQ
jgi:protein-histidine pros-kinase